MRETLQNSVSAVTRKKKIATADLESNKLKRCLSAWELTLFGVGSTVGPGLYVIIGQVARDTAGPSIVVSYALAAIACLFSAACYAEFAVRLPSAGSSYTYCYATVGELFAFVVGWNVIFENIIGFSVVAKAWSQYLDSFTNNTIRDHLMQTVIPGHSPMHFDVIAFALVLFFTIIVIIGANVTSTANVAFTVVNMSVCTLIIGFGSFYINIDNWRVFAPFGLSGIVKGSGKCFYSLLGFDVVATTCEETQDRRVVPKAMLLTLLVCFLLYFFTAAILTLIVPWYEIDVSAAFPHAFEALGFEWAKYVIVVGAVASLSASILGGLYASARITYSMAYDGLIFGRLGYVSDYFKTPIVSTAVVGLVGAVMALVFDLNSLVEMMSVGTLIAYSGVSASVLALRYQPWTLGFVQDENQPIAGSFDEYKALPVAAKTKVAKWNQLRAKVASTLDEHLGCSLTRPSTQSGHLAYGLIALFCGLVIIAALFVVYAQQSLLIGSIWAVVIIVVLVGLLTTVTLAFLVLPQNDTKLQFRVPMMPLWCLVSLTLNLSIMMTLSSATWIRVILWLSLGLTIYFGYGVRNSRENLLPGTSTEANELENG